MPENYRHNISESAGTTSLEVSSPARSNIGHQGKKPWTVSWTGVFSFQGTPPCHQCSTGLVRQPSETPTGVASLRVTKQTRVATFLSFTQVRLQRTAACFNPKDVLDLLSRKALGQFLFSPWAGSSLAVDCQHLRPPVGMGVYTNTLEVPSQFFPGILHFQETVKNTGEPAGFRKVRWK